MILPLNFIQANSASGLSGAISLAYSNTTTQGSLLIAMVLVVTTTLGGTFAATDSAGNTWYDAAPGAHYSSGTVEATIMVCNSNKTADSNTLTVTYSHAHSGGQMIIAEYRNQNAVSPVDGVAWILTSSGIAQTFSPVIASGQNEQIFVFASTGATSTITPPVGYNNRIAANSHDAQLMDGYVSAAGTYTPTWTYSSATTSIAASVSIKSAATFGNTTPDDILFIQAAPNAGSGITTVQFNAKTTPGNAYILAVYSSSGNEVTAVNDSEGNSWSLAARQVGQVAKGDEIEIWYALNVVGGTQNTATVTCASGLGTAAELTIHEYYGIATSNAFDQTNGATSTTGNFASGLVTPTTSGQLIFSYFYSWFIPGNDGGLFANPSLISAPLIPRYFNSGLSGAVPCSASFDLVESGIQAFNPSLIWSFNANTADWIALTATFKSAGNANKTAVNIVTDGNSFTQNDDTVANTTGITQIGITYQQTAQAALGNKYYFRNVGIGGMPGGLNTSGAGAFGLLGCCLNRAPLSVDLFYMPGFTNICFLECGLHDLADYSPMTAAQIYSQTIIPYVTARHAMGWKVVLVTLPSWIDGVDAGRLALNTLIRVNTAGADAICDWAGNANIGATNAYENSTYFLSDGHLTQLSNTTIIAPLVVTSIQLLSGGSPVGWSPVDSRQAVPGFGPGANTGIVDEQGNVIYSAQKPPFTGNSQVSDNSAIPPVDSRAAGAPVDSRASIPENSRVAPPFGGVGEP